MRWLKVMQGSALRFSALQGRGRSSFGHSGDVTERRSPIQCHFSARRTPVQCCAVQNPSHGPADESPSAAMAPGGLRPGR